MVHAVNLSFQKPNARQIASHTKVVQELLTKADAYGEELEKFLEDGQKMAAMLISLAQQLDNSHFGCNIGMLAGSLMSFLGGFLTIIGFATASFTFGATAPLAITGITITAVGGATVLGSGIGDFTTNTIFSNQAKQLVEKYQATCERLNQKRRSINDLIKILRQKITNKQLNREWIFQSLMECGRLGSIGSKIGSLVLDVVSGAETAAKVGLNFADDIARLGFGIGGASFARFLASPIGASILSSIGMIFDLIGIGFVARDMIINENKSKTAIEIREKIVPDLTAQLDSVQTILHELKLDAQLISGL